MVGFIFRVLGQVTVLGTRLALVLPVAYTRKRAAQRHFGAELRAQGLPSEVIEPMLAAYRDMLSLNPLAYRRSFMQWRGAR